MQVEFVFVFLFFFASLRTGKKKVSPDKMAEMQAKIEEERKALEAKLDMEEEERNKARAELEKREKDLLKAQWVLAEAVLKQPRFYP